MNPAEIPTPTQSQPVIWLEIGHLLDARRGRVLDGAHLVYDRERILHAGPDSPPEELVASAARVTLPDFLALPGLFDAHTHIFLSGSQLDPDARTDAQNLPPAELLDRAIERARIIRSLGIRGMRDGGDKDGVGLVLSQKSRQSTDLPRIFSPGAGIHRKGRYGAFFSQPAEDHPSLAACVAARAAQGADLIKLVPTGIINFNKAAVTAAPQFDTADARECTTAAAAFGLQVMAHASGADGIGHAIAGGVATIEHGFFITRDQLAMMRDRKISWVPTFAPVSKQVEYSREMGWSESVVDGLRRILDDHAASLSHALSLGVTVLVGSDAGSWGVSHVDGLLEEMWLLQQAGMPALEVLLQTTYGNPSTLAPDLPPSLIEAGQAPDFLLVPAAALQDVRHMTAATTLIGGHPTTVPREHGIL